MGQMDMAVNTASNIQEPDGAVASRAEYSQWKVICLAGNLVSAHERDDGFSCEFK